MMWYSVAALMVLLVLEAELCDDANCLYLHVVRPGLQKGGILSRICMIYINIYMYISIITAVSFRYKDKSQIFQHCSS